MYTNIYVYLYICVYMYAYIHIHIYKVSLAYDILCMAYATLHMAYDILYMAYAILHMAYDIALSRPYIRLPAPRRNGDSPFLQGRDGCIDVHMDIHIYIYIST